MAFYKHSHHYTPDWVSPAADYFITICAEPRGKNHLCTSEKGSLILNAIRLYHEKGNWHCSLGVLMPDHVHLLVSFPPDKILSRVIGLWKQGVSRHHKVPWQRNFFEHRLRNYPAESRSSWFGFTGPGLAVYLVAWSVSDRRWGQRRLPNNRRYGK